MLLVPPRAWEDVRTRSLATLVGDDPRPAPWGCMLRNALIWGVQRSVHAAPVADGEEVGLPGTAQPQSRPLDAVVLEGRAWGAHAPVGGVQDRLCPRVELQLGDRTLFALVW